jgi:uncharacterized protein (TIGR02597 family)
VNGDTIQIVPYWTLGTLFPNQAGISTTNSISGAGSMTRILVPDQTSAGIDLAATGSYYYYSGTGFTGPGWRRAGAGLTSKRDDDVIVPDSYVIIRQDGVGSNVVATATGSVASSDRRVVIGTIAANTPQDNAIALDVPVPMTLSQSNLYQSGVFVGTTSISGATGDKLLVFNDASAGINKAAGQAYYYYSGSGFGGPGWRLQGGGFTNIKNDDAVFQPGSGYIIRKEGTTEPNSFVWNIPVNY